MLRDRDHTPRATSIQAARRTQLRRAAQRARRPLTWLLRARNTAGVDAAQRAHRWGAWLTAQLELRGWRQAQLARTAKIPRDRVSKWVNGHEAPAHRNVVLVAHALGVPVAEAVAAAGLDERPAEPSPAAGLLARVPDSELLAELQRRARARERRILATIAGTGTGRRAPGPADAPDGAIPEEEILRAAALAPGYDPDDAPEPDPA